ncbi:MAG: hypothetical protein LBD90_00050, partial [Bifidobacteriaceae bacterium]|nr:hypothetical protein [Bifidobacteriaceae bacterium]
LFLAALGSLDQASVREPRFERAARDAVGWLRGPGGLDRTGFVRYRPDPNGLINQGWKDSAKAVVFADGTPASGEIALVEAQGYAWLGLQEAARLGRAVWGDPAWAGQLEQIADRLRRDISDRFWLPGADFPALALDGRDRQVDLLASNAGHLLWAGVVDPDQARRVAERLLSPDFFSGWGLRTVASGQAPYSPMSYHNGSVWPHDTALTALGMVRYGMTGHAERLAAGLLEAAQHWVGRLPELFGGFGRDVFPAPVSYPHAAAPQAWAAAATVVAARIAQMSSGVGPAASGRGGRA